MDEKEKKLLEKYVREHYWELNKAIDEGFKEFLKQKKKRKMQVIKMKRCYNCRWFKTGFEFNNIGYCIIEEKYIGIKYKCPLWTKRDVKNE